MFGDKKYVINLPSREDRKRECIKHAEKYNFDFEFVDIIDGFYKIDLTLMFFIVLPHRAFDFGVSCVADEYNVITVFCMSCNFEMNLGDQRAGCIKNTEVSFFGFLSYTLWHAVSAENNR